jgi:hypothetical protein
MRQSFHNFNTFWLRFHQQHFRFEILSNILSVRWLKLVFYCVSLPCVKFNTSLSFYLIRIAF